MKKSEFVKAVQEVLAEMSGTGAVGPLAVPAAFTPPGQGDNKPTKMMVKDFGYEKVKMKKRPYDTKGFSYLDENK